MVTIQRQLAVGSFAISFHGNPIPGVIVYLARKLCKVGPTNMLNRGLHDARQTGAGMTSAVAISEFRDLINAEAKINVEFGAG